MPKPISPYYGTFFLQHDDYGRVFFLPPHDNIASLPELASLVHYGIIAMEVRCSRRRYQSPAFSTIYVHCFNLVSAAAILYCLNTPELSLLSKVHCNGNRTSLVAFSQRTTRLSKLRLSNEYLPACNCYHFSRSAAFIVIFRSFTRFFLPAIRWFALYNQMANVSFADAVRPDNVVVRFTFQLRQHIRVTFLSH